MSKERMQQKGFLDRATIALTTAIGSMVVTGCTCKPAQWGYKGQMDAGNSKSFPQKSPRFRLKTQEYEGQLLGNTGTTVKCSAVTR